MSRSIEGGDGVPDADPGRTPPAPSPGPLATIALAAWLGLAGGVSELVAFVAIRARSGEVWPYLGKIRAYPWTIPLVDAGLLVALALLIALLAPRLPWAARPAVPTALLALALLPTLLLLAPGLYAGALLLLAAGAASVVVRLASTAPGAVALIIRATLPMLLVGVAGLAAWRSAPMGPPGRGSPPANAPNVLLIVLDTVRADHTSLPGSEAERDLTPELLALARRGVTFTGARSTAPWTLPSHASLMTGRPASEVVVGRYGAMVRGVPTLAEVLDARGYDTAGIVANTYFTSYATGLSRGFRRYEDLPITPASVLASTEFGGRLVDLLGRWADAIRPGSLPSLRRFERIDAAAINRRFLDWLDRRPDRGRPFFAFLNYFDAHDPFLVPAGSAHRFGTPPTAPADRAFLEGFWLDRRKERTPPERLTMLVDGYDSCIAALDDRLGALFRSLDDRGMLDSTIVVVTSDHGEAFGEHGLFGHGVSLYEDQIRVPLVVFGPGRVPEGLRVDDVVTLADLPATILELVGVPGPTLPGTSLTSRWEGRDRGADGDRAVPPTSVVVSSAAGPESFPPNAGRSPVVRGPMVAITDGSGLKYIRSDTDGRPAEELFDLNVDPAERVNLAPESSAVLDRFREALEVAAPPRTAPEP